jgi:monofunctional biosynthetic peptidoglycan transglycosylase
MLRRIGRVYVVAVLVFASPVLVVGSRGRSSTLRAALLIPCIAQWIASVVVLSLRWVNPPTTAFMWRTTSAQRRANSQLEADGPAANRTPSRVEFTWVPEAELAPELRLAAIAGEDVYFAVHDGFDWESLRSARADNRTAGRRQRGGSTISQQVAKNLFLWPRRSYLRKGLEAYLTVLIEATWPKRRILEVYLNIAQFGPVTFGAEAASRRFFDKPAAALSRSEAALLVAALPSPEQRRVDRPDRAVRYRQLLIVGSMNKLGPRYLERLGAPRTSAGSRRG